MKFLSIPYEKLSREGLSAYLKQSPGSHEGRTDWDVDILATLFLNVEDAAMQEGARLAWTRAGVEKMVRDTELVEAKLYDANGFILDQKEFFRVTQLLKTLNQLFQYLPEEK
jgi:hypothetical protein